MKGREGLINEVEILRNLNHENVVKLFEVYESENNLYLVMGIEQGGSLS